MLYRGLMNFINRAGNQVTNGLLRFCHSDSRSEAFVFKNVLPRSNRCPTPKDGVSLGIPGRFDLALPR